MGASCNNVSSGIGANILHLSDVDGLLSISTVGLTTTLTITIPGGGMYMYEIWLSDSATDSTESLFQPTPSTQTRWSGNTDSSGSAVISITNNGASRTWYAWGTFLRANVSAAITVGV